MAVPEWLTKYRLERKRKAVEILGGQCTQCATDKDLQFDHISPNSKINNVASMIRSCSWESILSELTKCQLLCKPCHQVKSAEEKAGKEHGRPNMWRRGCRCEPCKQSKRDSVNQSRWRTGARKQRGRC